jgi:hypothetical protein
MMTVGFSMFRFIAKRTFSLSTQRLAKAATPSDAQGLSLAKAATPSDAQVGNVLSVNSGVAFINGLNLKEEQMVEFASGLKGMYLGLILRNGYKSRRKQLSSRDPRQRPDRRIAPHSLTLPAGRKR